MMQQWLVSTIFITLFVIHGSEFIHANPHAELSTYAKHWVQMIPQNDMRTALNIIQTFAKRTHANNPIASLWLNNQSLIINNAFDESLSRYTTALFLLDHYIDIGITCPLYKSSAHIDSLQQQLRHLLTHIRKGIDDTFTIFSCGVELRAMMAAHSQDGWYKSNDGLFAGAYLALVTQATLLHKLHHLNMSLEQRIGSGTFGEIYALRNKSNDQMYAMKFFTQKRDCAHERNIMIYIRSHTRNASLPMAYIRMEKV
eukprot:51828_1